MLVNSGCLFLRADYSRPGKSGVWTGHVEVIRLYNWNGSRQYDAAILVIETGPIYRPSQKNPDDAFARAHEPTDEAGGGYRPILARGESESGTIPVGELPQGKRVRVTGITRTDAIVPNTPSIALHQDKGLSRVFASKDQPKDPREQIEHVIIVKSIREIR